MEFLTGGHAAPAQTHRALRTVLFTDIVASTQRAAAVGDERWRAVLQRFGEITAEITGRFGGTVVKSTGDGHLMTFDGPTHAIRCSEALRADAETLGIDIRVGIHTGEIELLDADIGGIAVHIAARMGPSRPRRDPRLSYRARSSRRLGHWLRGPRQRGAAGCARHLATAGSRSQWPAGGIGRGGTGSNAHPRPSSRDASFGPRAGGGGQAHTMDPAWNGPPRRVQ